MPPKEGALGSCPPSAHARPHCHAFRLLAGREDIDVRMLGSGRPFILEVHNARHRVPPPDALRRLQAAVAEVSGVRPCFV